MQGSCRADEGKEVGTYMIDAEYHREINHNYLLLESKSTDKADDHQDRMLISRKWEHLLRCSKRMINGRQVYYYEINSKASLQNYFSAGKMKVNDMLVLLQQLEAACGEINDYLMDEEKLVLDPEFVFYDMDQAGYSFLYYPCAENVSEDHGNRLLPLFDFMLGAADESDSDTTDFIYRIYELAEHENFSLAGALDDYHADAGGKMEDTCSAGMIAETERQDHCETNDRQEKEGYGKGEEIPRKIFGIVGLVMAAGLIMAVYMHSRYIFSSKEELLFYAACSVMLFTGIAALALFVCRKSTAAKKDPRSTESEPDAQYNAQSAETAAQVIMPGAGNGSNEKNYDGKTVFFSQETDPLEYKLYAEDKKNRQHIGLEKMPCIIGKLAGNVDICIKDESISRLHARIDYSEGCYTVTDLNSTNGTYVNGMQLGPNETVELTKGDEVRFGELNYCLR